MEFLVTSAPSITRANGIANDLAAAQLLRAAQRPQVSTVAEAVGSFAAQRNVTPMIALEIVPDLAGARRLHREALLQIRTSELAQQTVRGVSEARCTGTLQQQLDNIDTTRLTEVRG